MTMAQRVPLTLASMWREAASDLGLEIVAPFSAHLGPAGRVDVAVLLRDFGADRGMLLVSDYTTVEQHAQRLVEAGFGYSVMSEPDPSERYSRDYIIEILEDWGWSGPPDRRPTWLK
jgi:hypothetical protein